MRRRTLLPVLLVSALALAGVLAVGPPTTDEPTGEGPPILAQQDRDGNQNQNQNQNQDQDPSPEQAQDRDRDRLNDGTCAALDPREVRARFREEFCALLCLEPISADAEVAEVTRILRRSPLAAREAAVEELLFDVAIRDTAAAAGAIAGIAERHGLPEDALREAVALARERLLIRLREEGDLDAPDAACLMERVRSEFRHGAEDAAD
jgi:hypothetical protein